MRLRIFLLGLLLLADAANACTCVAPPLTTEIVRQAKQVFIFRLMQARVDVNELDAQGRANIVGEIEMIDHVRGSKKPPSEIVFSTATCCGSRLDVGSYFAAFVSTEGRRLVVNTGNVLEVGRGHDLDGAGVKVRAVLSGKQRIEDVFDQNQLDRTEQAPVLAPCGQRQQPMRVDADASRSE